MTDLSKAWVTSLCDILSNNFSDLYLPNVKIYVHKVGYMQLSSCKKICFPSNFLIYTQVCYSTIATSVERLHTTKLISKYPWNSFVVKLFISTDLLKAFSIFTSSLLRTYAPAASLQRGRPRSRVFGSQVSLLSSMQVRRSPPVRIFC